MSANMKKIGGRTFSFGVMPATVALGVEVSVMRVIGEPLFKALTTAEKKDKGKMLEIGGAAVGLMAARMDAAELQRTMQTVFEYVSVDGQRVNIDSHFTGRNKELWQVFIEALQVNFADFFSELPWASDLMGATSESKQ
jgi:tail assembly chaperone